MKQDIQIIAFQGNQILTVERDGKHYVVMRTVCESKGLNGHRNTLALNDMFFYFQPLS